METSTKLKMLLNCLVPLIGGSLLITCPLISCVEAVDIHDVVGTMDLIKSRGFLAESYALQNDGHTLSLYRIINPLANQATLNKYPVLYGHGVLFDAMSMISRSENSRPRKPLLGEPTVKFGSLLDSSDDYSLPFMLSNNNFDVWLFDARGTNENNRNFSDIADFAQTQRFWDFSLDDQSLSDLPAQIDFVLLKTRSTKLVYVGYSETTFFMFSLLSAIPHYADKIVACLMLAPVAYVGHVRGLAVPAFTPAALLMPDFLHYSFWPPPLINSFDFSFRTICDLKGINSIVCGNFINSIGGRGVGEHKSTFFAKLFKSTSVKSVKQFLQLLLSKRFAMYDYGPVENFKRYGQVKAPDFDLSRIRTDRLIVARGLSDFLSNPEDQSVLLSKLGTKPYLDIVLPEYNHFDFIDGKDLIRLINAPALKAIYDLMYRDSSNIIKYPLLFQSPSVF